MRTPLVRPSSALHSSLSLGLTLLGLSLMGAACGDSSNPGAAPAAGNPQTQSEPATPAPAPAANPDPGAAMPNPAPVGSGGSSNSGTAGETPTGPVGFAGSSAQAPGGTSPGGNNNPGANNPPATPDAGAAPTPPVTPPPVTPPPVTPPAFSPCPSDGTPCRIMPLGDSITFGVGSSGGGYRVDLFRRALADQRDITFVGVVAPGGSNTPNGPNMVNGQAFPRNHEGFSGFTISGGGAGSLAAQVDNAIAQTDPNIVLLMIGTNDVNGNIDVANAPNRLGALLDQIINDAPDSLLAVAQLIPTMTAQTNTRVQSYNAAIPALVRSRAAAGKHVVLVDMFTPFNSNPNFAGLMNDNLHPNDSGYVVMAQTWYAAIDDLLPPQ
jgi:lysophospholipase L1-like esterase